MKVLLSFFSLLVFPAFKAGREKEGNKIVYNLYTKKFKSSTKIKKCYYLIGGCGFLSLPSDALDKWS
jgi:hypothetical protein